mgnify:CR=1 FL=1|jgi:ferredoxin
MKRNIIKIDEDKCNGCGICVTACHEGALRMINGKARLISEAYCDGLGACLPECPTGAITIEEREAEAFDEEAVKANMARAQQHNAHPAEKVQASAPMACGCPGSQARAFDRKSVTEPAPVQTGTFQKPESQLRQWPCQIKLVHPQAPYFENAHLLIAADCTAYAYANIHNEFMKNKITLIGCPKLDDGDYSEKLTAILAANNIKSVTVLRMEVPCCGGIVQAVKNALIASGKMIPWQVVIITTDGQIKDE